MFSKRYNHIPVLVKMGADISVVGNTAKVSGSSVLTGCEVAATDVSNNRKMQAVIFA